MASFSKRLIAMHDSGNRKPETPSALPALPTRRVAVNRWAWAREAIAARPAGAVAGIISILILAIIWCFGPASLPTAAALRIRQTGHAIHFRTTLPRAIHPEDLGIVHLRVPGELRNTSEAVLLHLWVRRQVLHGKAKFMGWGFMEALVHVRTWSIYSLLQPVQVSEVLADGALLLYDAHTSNLASNLTVVADLVLENHHHNLARPFWLHGDLAGSAATVDLRILDWSRFARFTWPSAVDAGLVTAPLDEHQLSTLPKKGWLAGPEKPPPSLEHPSDQLVFVMQPPYGLDFEKIIAALWSHVSWHKEVVGVAGYLVYVFPEHIAAITADAYLAGLQREGFLQLMTWDQEVTEHRMGDPFPDQDSPHPNHPNFASADANEFSEPHEVLIYNHALLATRGRGVTLMIANIDEFIATPSPKKAPQIVRECLVGGLSSKLLPQRLVRCGNCNGTEIDDWVADRRASVDMGSERPSIELHPLRRYWLSHRVLNYGKSMAVPERTQQFRQHEGLATAGGKHSGDWALCDAQVLHAMMLFANRSEFYTDVFNHTAWQWAFGAQSE